MPIVESKYRPKKLLNNGHFQTIYPYLFRKIKNLNTRRHRLDLPDGDFVDLDISDNGSDELIVLSHGLEGSTTAAYIKGMTKYFSQGNKYDILAWNMRSCSGELNKKEMFYHGALIEDLHAVIKYALQTKTYKKIYLAGFSLGGNLTAYYLASMGSKVPSQIQAAVLFSSPFELSSSVHKLQSSKFGKIYSQSFLKTMKQKAMEKCRNQMLNLDITIKQIRRIKNFYEFDTLLTAPLCGFKSADDYYHKASAIHILDKIQVPTLIVQAQNDPFLAKESFPVEIAQGHENIFLEVTPSGGHVGFLNYEQGLEFWSEHRMAEFIKQVG